MQPIPTDPAGAASWAHNLAVLLGAGPHLAATLGSIAGIVTLIKAVLPDVVAWLPIADASSSRFYRNVYGTLARATGGYRNAAPVPPSGEFAGGIVPVPPSVKKEMNP